MALAIGPGMSAQSLDFGRLTEDYSKLTVREVISSTSGVSLAQLVATRAAIQLLTLVDARRFARVELVAPGGGSTWHFQKVVAVAPTSSGEPVSGTDITLQDPTLTDVTAVLNMFRIGTFVGDMAQRQAAVNLAEVVGIAHGNGMNQQMNLDIYTTLGVGGSGGSTTNVVKEGGSGTLVSVNYTFSDLFSMRGLVEQQRGRPDTMITYPTAALVGAGGVTTGWYPFVQSNITSVQYTAALADYLRTGSIAEIFGLRLFVDFQFAGVNANFPANAKDVMATVLVSNEAVGWAQAEDIVSEVQRWALQVGFRVVTHSIGKSAMVLEPFTANTQHA
jgi:hypothetical protein